MAIWDQPSEVLEHVRRYQVPYPNGIDANGVIAIDYGVTGLPEKFFIGRDGVLLKKFVGPMRAGNLRTILDEILASDRSPSTK